MSTSTRLAIREELQRLETLRATAADLDAASTRAQALLAELRERTRRPHACHVCGKRTKKDEL
jgi:hypothetical protein